jgi:hypothetical protein
MNINNFARKMVGAGVKPSLFEVDGRIGPQGSNDKVPFLVKSASLPGQALGVIEVPYRGRRIKLPGDRQFADWSITIINDSAFDLRNRFERWLDSLQGMESNTAVASFDAFAGTAFADWTVNQLDRNGKPIKAYKLIGCFPTDISPIELSYEATDQIEEFSVTLAYSYFIPYEGLVTPVSNQVGLAPLTQGASQSVLSVPPTAIGTPGVG